VRTNAVGIVRIIIYDLTILKKGQFVEQKNRGLFEQKSTLPSGHIVATKELRLVATKIHSSKCFRWLLYKCRGISRITRQAVRSTTLRTKM
jgi:hypothetical protein